MFTRDDAKEAMSHSTPVAYMLTGEIGIIDHLHADGDAMVLFLGDRIAKLTPISELAPVDLSALLPQLPKSAGKVHGGPKGAKGK